MEVVHRMLFGASISYIIETCSELVRQFSIRFSQSVKPRRRLFQHKKLPSFSASQIISALWPSAPLRRVGPQFVPTRKCAQAASSRHSLPVSRLRIRYGCALQVRLSVCLSVTDDIPSRWPRLFVYVCAQLQCRCTVTIPLPTSHN